LLIQWPGVLTPGSTYGQPVITFDLSATALAAAGANAGATAGLPSSGGAGKDPSSTDGVDLLPYLQGRAQGPPHAVLFWRSRTMSNNYAARQGDWKFVHSTEGDAAPGPKQKPARDMLFNLAQDVREQRDLAAEQPARLAELKKLYEAWNAEVDAECRQMGLVPKLPQPAAPAQSAAKQPR
jgi:arylsulfatase A-like enzyme